MLKQSIEANSITLQLRKGSFGHKKLTKLSEIHERTIVRNAELKNRRSSNRQRDLQFPNNLRNVAAMLITARYNLVGVLKELPSEM